MKRLSFLGIAILATAVASAEPRWQPVGPQAGPLSARLFFGVLFSADGAAWRPLNGGLPRTWINSLFTDPSDPTIVYATVLQSGVYALRTP